MTSNWLPQQPWMNVTPQRRAGNPALTQGITALGSALVNRNGDEDDDDEETPQATDSPLLKRKTGILSLLGGSGTDTFS